MCGGVHGNIYDATSKGEDTLSLVADTSVEKDWLVGWLDRSVLNGSTFDPLTAQSRISISMC